MRILKRWIKNEEAANLVEYALLMTLVAVPAAVGLPTLGNSLAFWFNKIAADIGALLVM